MILSRMVLNLDARNARRDLADPYEMHATLMRLTDDASTRPLWRLRSGRTTEPPTVLVQTDDAPDPTRIPMSDEPYYRSFDSRHNRLLDAIKGGDILRFRVRTNPTVKRAGKRHGLLHQDRQLAWLARQLDRSGADLQTAEPTQVAREILRRRRNEKPIVLTGVTFDGLLTVRDPDVLREAVRHGIGHARAFGFGLITLAR